jgi:hypothetical protein
MHMAFAGQALSHSPQCMSSLSVFTQAPPQVMFGALHGPPPPAPPAPVVVVELVVVVVELVVVVVDPELLLVVLLPSQLQAPKVPSSRHVCEPTVPPAQTQEVTRPAVQSSLAQAPSCMPARPNKATAPAIQVLFTTKPPPNMQPGTKSFLHRRGFVPIHPSRSRNGLHEHFEKQLIPAPRELRQTRTSPAERQISRVGCRPR